MGLVPQVQLQDGERIVLDRDIPRSIFWPVIVLTLGLGELIRRLSRFVITDRRVIVMAGMPGARRVTSVPLERVQDAVVKQQLWRGDVLLTNAGGSPGTQGIGPLTISEAREFANAVLAGASRQGGTWPI